MSYCITIDPPVVMFNLIFRCYQAVNESRGGRIEGKSTDSRFDLIPLRSLSTLTIIQNGSRSFRCPRAQEAYRHRHHGARAGRQVSAISRRR